MKFIFALCLFTIPLGVQANFKVAYIDMQQALQSSSVGKKAKSKLEKQFKRKHEELTQREKDLEKSLKTFEKTRMVLSAKKQQERQLELQKEFTEFQKDLRASQMDFKTKQKEATLPIIKNIQSIMSEIAKKEGYSMIFEQAEHRVLWAQKGLDITDQVLEAFEKKYK